MATRNSTIVKYTNAARIVHAHVLHGFSIDRKQFSDTHDISAGFFGYLLDAGFMQQTALKTYRWGSTPINHQTIGAMLQTVDAQRTIRRNKARIPVDTPAANEVIEPVKEVAPEPEVKVKVEVPAPPEPYNLDRISELEQRVASLEQLLIRRSIA